MRPSDAFFFVVGCTSVVLAVPGLDAVLGKRTLGAELNWSSCKVYTDWQPKGCIPAPANTIWAPELPVDANNKISGRACWEICKGKGLPFAGITLKEVHFKHKLAKRTQVKWVQQCGCSGVHPGAASAATNCPQQCNDNMPCGGNGFYSVYMDKTLPGANPSSSNGEGYEKYNCYRDDKFRMLSAEQSDLDAKSMTPALCLKACGGKGYFYAGLTNGNLCFCGNELNKRLPGFGVMDESLCRTPCSGDPNQFCGGRGATYESDGADINTAGFIQLWKNPSLKSSQPCGCAPPPPPPPPPAYTNSPNYHAPSNNGYKDTGAWKAV
jgi:hypothetical protein